MSDLPFVVRQFEGTPWVPLHEAARLHDAHQAAELRVIAAQNEAAALRDHIRRYGPLPVRGYDPVNGLEYDAEYRWIVHTDRGGASAVVAENVPPEWAARFLRPRTPYGVVPANCRLILASDKLLDFWGTRTERGERITVEWGEPSAEGWYEPQFTVHSDDVLGADR